jgi:hypothetical protein
VLKALLAVLVSSFSSYVFLLKNFFFYFRANYEFYTDRAKTRTVKTPCDLVVGAMRAFGIRKGDGKYVGPAVREMGEQLGIMGMNLFEPPNVAGWPGGLAWMNSGTLLSRLEFAKDLAASDFGPNKLPLGNITGLPLGDATADPGVVVDAIIAQVSLDQGPLALTPTQRQYLIDYATTDTPTLDLSSEFTDDANTKVRGLISLVLQTAEYQIF